MASDPDPLISTTDEAALPEEDTSNNVDSSPVRHKTPVPSAKEHSRLQELQSAEEKKILDTVDSLREYGLGRLTNLPQLIVCGGQSTGKSSLLEAISGVPFPRNATLCTRFATEVVLRRDASARIRVSIMPNHKRPEDEKDILRKFQHQIQRVDDLPTLINKAMSEMGLLDGAGSEFSEDILKVEVFGPDQSQVTIVDLPGLIQSIADGKEEADIGLVEDIVTGYMKNPRSVILAVIAANNDPANQRVLQKVKEVDQNGDRTLGIITKPDLVSGPDEQNLILKYARNELRAFKLGWHVVRNSDQKAFATLYAADRDQQELAFFRNSAFKPNASRKLEVGAISLRKRLSKILFTQIQASLPSLLEDISSGIAKCKEELRQLGPGRPTIADQKEYLMNVSQEFFALTKSAVRGVYDDRFFHDAAKPQRKLCAILMNLHDDFAENMRLEGSKWKLAEQPASVLLNSSSDTRTRAQAVEAARDLLKDNRGRELPGLPGSAIIHELFVEYSSKWGHLGLAHIKDVQLAIEYFVQEALEYIGGIELGQKLKDFWLEELIENNFESAKLELEKLLSVHQELPMTFNPSFQRKVRDLFTKKAQEGLVETIATKFFGTEAPSIATITEFLKSEEARKTNDSSKDAAELAFDIMQVHYEIALDLYIDNVPTLAIWSPLIRSLPSLFAPGEVIKMEDDVVKHIAGDSEDVEALRKELNGMLNILNKGFKEATRHVSRSTLLAMKNKSRNESTVSTPQPARTVSSNSDVTASQTSPSPAQVWTRSKSTLSPSASSEAAPKNQKIGESRSLFGQATSQSSASNVMTRPWAPPSSSTPQTLFPVTKVSNSSFGSAPTGGPLQNNSQTPSSLFSTTNSGSTTGGLFSGSSSSNKATSVFGGFGSAPPGTSLFGSSASTTNPGSSNLFSNDKPNITQTKSLFGAPGSASQPSKSSPFGN